MGSNDGLVQVFSVAAIGILMLIINNFVLGIVVDYFLDFGAGLNIENFTLRECMSTILGFGTWFYAIINIMAVLFCCYPIVYIIMRHRYMTSQIEAVQDQQIMQ